MSTIVAIYKVGGIYAWLKCHQNRANRSSPAVPGFKTFLHTEDFNSVILRIYEPGVSLPGAIINDILIIYHN